MPEHSYSLQFLAVSLDADFLGEKDRIVTGLSDLSRAKATDITFLASTKYIADLPNTLAAAVVLTKEAASDFQGNALIVEDPYLAFAKLSALFETRQPSMPTIDPSASIANSAIIGKGVSIGPFCSVGDHAQIADGVELAAGVKVGDSAKIGQGTLIHPNVVIYHEVTIGERVIIHANTTIGSDGFGFAPHQGQWQKIHQIGRVIIGSDVEIGANVSIDRGALDDTVIEDHVIIDNQVHIAHNCVIGEGSALAGCVGFAGSTKLGKHCRLGGFVAVGGHLEIADGTTFNGATIVTKGNKEPGAFASSAPLQELGAWRKNSARIRQLDTLYKRVVALEKRLQEPDKDIDSEKNK